MGRVRYLPPPFASCLRLFGFIWLGWLVVRLVQELSAACLDANTAGRYTPYGGCSSEIVVRVRIRGLFLFGFEPMGSIVIGEKIRGLIC